MPVWQRDDTEAVVCCVCHREGRPIYDLDPFGVVRCPRCGLVFVSPRLRPDALQRLYDAPEYHGRVYGGNADFLQRQWTKGRLALATRETRRPLQGARLLEIGAGHGSFLDAARTAGYDVTGVELSVTAAEHARTALGLTIHSTQLEDAPLEGRFDVVCAWDTIEHVPDPVQFWAAVRQVVADDGVVLFSTPYFSSLPSRLLRQRWWTLKPTEHIWQFTPTTHRTAAAVAGMRVTRTIRNPLSSVNVARLDSLVGVARPE
ncbi:MAG: class I SAM-dependent methyltransferase [Jatrophihabitans sp.]